MSTAELAVLVSGAVGLGAPAIAAYFQRGRDRGAARREREASDRQELRSLLDETTATLHARTKQLISLEKWMQASFLHRPRPASAPSVEQSDSPLIASLEARLVIRRGREDALVESFHSYLKVTDAALAEIGMLWDEGEPFDYDDDDLERRADRYRDAFAAFLDRAKRVLD